jgi:hypothetical protein
VSDLWFTPPDLCAEIAHLAGVFAPAGCRLVEPCAGDGRLASLLPRCEAFDIEPRSPAVSRRDALKWRGSAPYFVATNAPFSVAKQLLRHWASDPMWQGAVVVLPAVAWRWAWDIPGGQLVLDGRRDMRFECAETGRFRLVKAQLQLWLPGDSGPEPFPPPLVAFCPRSEADALVVHHGSRSGEILGMDAARSPNTVGGIRELRRGVLDAIREVGHVYRAKWSRATGAPFMTEEDLQYYANQCFNSVHSPKSRR